jgi:hypothetical protein
MISSSVHISESLTQSQASDFSEAWDACFMHALGSGDTCPSD